jgi:uncharacterized LabA/DUF88 family protein
MERIGLFVDVQKIYYTTRHAYGRQFDYRVLWNISARVSTIEVANAYATDRGDKGQRKFQAALRNIGFTVKLKPYIQRADGSAKGDWDVGITIDVLQNASELDRIFLLSDDGDFDLLIDTVQTLHVTPVEIYGVPALTADSLVRAATAFHLITKHLLV